MSREVSILKNLVFTAFFTGCRSFAFPDAAAKGQTLDAFLAGERAARRTVSRPPAIPKPIPYHRQHQAESQSDTNVKPQDQDNFSFAFPPKSVSTPSMTRHTRSTFTEPVPYVLHNFCTFNISIYLSTFPGKR